MEALYKSNNYRLRLEVNYFECSCLLHERHNLVRFPHKFLLA